MAKKIRTELDVWKEGPDRADNAPKSEADLYRGYESFGEYLPTDPRAPEGCPQDHGQGLPIDVERF